MGCFDPACERWFVRECKLSDIIVEMFSITLFVNILVDKYESFILKKNPGMITAEMTSLNTTFKIPLGHNSFL